MLKDNLMLYLVTDSKMCGDNFENIIETAIKAGVTMVQLREKDITFEEFCKKALKLKEICIKYKVPLIINDNVDICVAVNADGVHLGSSDMDIVTARSILGNSKIIGGSCRDSETAKLLENSGADYLGVGAVFGTQTKQDAKTISVEILKQVCSSINIPVVAIGGVNAENIAKLKGSGVAGVAVISSILKAKNVEIATKNICEQLKQIL